MSFFKRSLSQKRQASRAKRKEEDGPPTLGLDGLDLHDDQSHLVGSLSSERDNNYSHRREAVSATSSPSKHKPPIGRSLSQPQALPYHRPWNRNLAENDLTAPEQTPSTISGLPLDFRVSPSAIPQLSPSQRKQAIDTARRNSLKRAKAPTVFNILVMGGKMTGKTSWARTLLATFDLAHCSEETKVAASHFGIASSSSHSSRETDPITPLATQAFQVLSGIELQPESLLPLSTLEAGGPSGSSSNMHSGSTKVKARPSSIASTRTSLFSAGGTNESGKIQFSICDTPGIDYELEDEFEVNRKATRIVKHIEEKLARTLNEEGKVQRRNRSDDHIHLVVYFIDPRQLVERNAMRRRDVQQSRYGRSPSVAEGARNRSNSESHLPGLKRTVSSASSGDQRESREAEEDQGVEGLSSTELGILARISRLTNVLPVIAKADTLTSQRLGEVRQAVRASLRASKVDLGAFDIGKVKRRKSGGRKGDSGDGNEKVDEVSSRDQEPTKVIRLRRSRSYTGSSLAEEHKYGPLGKHSYNNGNANDGGTHGSGEGEEQEEEVVEGPTKEELLKMIPFSIFVPEPVRTARRRKPTAARRSSGMEEELIDATTQDDQVPPVPPLPRRLHSSNSIFREAGDTSVAAAEHTPPPLRPSTDSSSVFLPTVLPSSNRFKRNYRWGDANVLDPEQCDFGLLRTTILGTHLEAIRESNALCYENFRTHRMQLNRVLRQGSRDDIEQIGVPG